MIERITIKNFQCHEHFDLELDPHVTTLVGESDAGKTAILRALRFAALNRPGGTAFIHHSVARDSGTSDVTLHLDGASRVTRRRSNKINVYRLDEARYVSFGAGKVPSEIQTLLNMDEINFQTQHSPHFWFSDSPQQVSKALNSIINLGAIDRALANVAAAVRRARTREEVCQERLDKAKIEQQLLSWVPAFDADLAELEEQERSLQLKRDRCARIRHFISSLTKARSDANQPVPNIQLLEKQHNKVIALQRRVERLRELHDGITEARRALCHHQNQYEEAKQQLNKTQQNDNLCPTCGQPIPIPSASSVPISTSRTPRR